MIFFAPFLRAENQLSALFPGKRAERRRKIIFRPFSRKKGGKLIFRLVGGRRAEGFKRIQARASSVRKKVGISKPKSWKTTNQRRGGRNRNNVPKNALFAIRTLTRNQFQVNNDNFESIFQLKIFAPPADPILGTQRYFAFFPNVFRRRVSKEFSRASTTTTKAGISKPKSWKSTI